MVVFQEFTQNINERIGGWPLAGTDFPTLLDGRHPDRFEFVEPELLLVRLLRVDIERLVQFRILEVVVDDTVVFLVDSRGYAEEVRKCFCAEHRRQAFACIYATVL